MRKLASHRVLYSKTGRIFAMYVVEINPDGSAVRAYPLCGEGQGIEWLPGLLLLSPVVPSFIAGECFADFVQRMQEETVGIESDDRLYWVTPFDVASMKFCPETRLHSLKG